MEVNRNPYGNHWDSTDHRNWEVVPIMHDGVSLFIERMPGTSSLIGFADGVCYREVGGQIHQYLTGIHALERAVRHGLAYYRNEVNQLDQVWTMVGDGNIPQVDLVTMNAFDLWAVNSRLQFGRALQMLRAIQGSRSSRSRRGESWQDHLQKVIDQLEAVASTPFDRLGRVNSGRVQAKSAAALRAILKRILHDNGASAGLTQQLLLVMQLIQQIEQGLKRGAAAMSALHNHAIQLRKSPGTFTRQPHYWLHRACEQLTYNIPPYDRVFARILGESMDVRALMEDDGENNAKGHPRYRGTDITAQQWGEIAEISNRSYYAFQFAALRGPIERLMWYLSEDGQAEFPGQKDVRLSLILTQRREIVTRLDAIDTTTFKRQTKAELADALGAAGAYLQMHQFELAKKELKAAFDPESPMI